MKKKIIYSLLLTVLLLPIRVFAEKVDITNYNTTNLEEAFKDESIKYDLGTYQENDNQVTVYMFRGKGCIHCQDFLQYVNDTLLKQYGDKFKLITFETWYDTKNSALLDKVVNFLGEEKSAVPFIIIGDKHFLGYASSLNSEIEAAITNLYNSKKRYDVFEEMNKEEKKGTTNTTAIVLWNAVITAIGVGIVIWHNQSTKNQIIEELSKKTSKNK